jgi:predicted 2-oxoglutarate/Fe(II)-dependent dioxygenase YbiX
MIHIEENLKLLNGLELDFVESKLNIFTDYDDAKIYEHGEVSIYVRQNIPNAKDNLPIFFNNLERYIKKITDVEYIFDGLWINKVTEETNKDDTFHYDIPDFTMIMYLNDDFSGGEFEYIDEKNNNIKIKPKKDLVIFSNNQLLHRVLPVTMGIRYSLVCFFKFQTKTKKTFL